MEHISVHIRLSPYGEPFDKRPLKPGFVIAFQRSRRRHLAGRGGQILFRWSDDKPIGVLAWEYLTQRC